MAAARDVGTADQVADLALTPYRAEPIGGYEKGLPEEALFAGESGRGECYFFSAGLPSWMLFTVSSWNS